jgi:hypothetical protein
VPAPAIPAGTVEQAIFTWSKVNLDGHKGQGFGAVSAGLTDSLGWLQAIDSSHWKLADESLSHGAERYEGWTQFVATGAFQAEGVSFVYRKIASVGVDGHQRNRSLIHMLVGRPGELDLAAVSDDDVHWLGAEDCPLDELPDLGNLHITQLTPRSMPHDCAVRDPAAEVLREGLMAATTTLVIGLDEPIILPAEAITALLIAVPTALWPNIELDWYVGPLGPIAKIGLPDRLSPRADDRTPVSGLVGCELHRLADELWNEMIAHQRTWRSFAYALRAQAAAAVADATPNASDDTASPLLPPRSAASHQPASAESGRTVIAGAIGEAHWSHERALSDLEAGRALDSLLTLRAPIRGWLKTFSAPEWNAILSGIDSPRSFNRTISFFNDTDATTADLANAWRDHGVAALGLALLGRWPGEELGEGWAVPKRVDTRNLRRLAHHLVKTEHGLKQLALLFHGGFAADQNMRRRLVKVLDEAKLQSRTLYGKVLVDADLPPEVLLDMMRDDVDGFARWLKVPGVYKEALRLGLTRRRREWLATLLPLVGGGDSHGARERHR